MLDRLEIVVAPIQLPLGRVLRAELIVNGTPLASLLEAAEDNTGHAPLVVDDVLPHLRDALRHGLRPTRVQVLGCTCGDDRCSWVTLTQRSRPEAVCWDGFQTSRTDELAAGPFIFDRALYETALRAPRRAEQPVGRYAED